MTNDLSNNAYANVNLSLNKIYILNINKYYHLII